jgi:hypothetical protein
MRVPLDAHGPNRLAHDETPYRLTRSCLYWFLSFLFPFSFKELVKGHCPVLVTKGGNVIHKYFHGNEKVVS